MAAPTNPRVESNSVTSAIIRWTYTDGSPIVVYRALHGGSYSAINADSPVAPGTTEYLDITVTMGTFYDYKLSDDGGSTFSSVVSVVIQTCQVTSSSNQLTSGAALPQFTSQKDISVENLSNLATQVEAATNTDKIADSCEACITDGAVIFDCSDGCFNFEVNVTDDVNSISVSQCEEGKGGTITWNFPPNTTRKVCGWPAGSGFSGDECFNNPVVSGSTGRSMKSSLSKGRANSAASKKGYGKGAGGGAGPGGTGCACKTDAVNSLTIKSCNANNSLKCDTTKSLDLIACGGRPPYTWSKTGSITLSRTVGDKVTVKPPTNSGSGVAGTAYYLYGKFAGGSAGVCTNAYIRSSYGCGDAEVTADCVTNSCDPADACTSGPSITSCTVMDCVTCDFEAVITCNGAKSCETPCTAALTNCNVCQGNCSHVQRGKGTVCDQRTAPMIAAGCNPCGLQVGSTVTVTDQIGATVTLILRA